MLRIFPRGRQPVFEVILEVILGSGDVFATFNSRMLAYVDNLGTVFTRFADGAKATVRLAVPYGDGALVRSWVRPCAFLELHNFFETYIQI